MTTSLREGEEAALSGTGAFLGNAPQLLAGAGAGLLVLSTAYDFSYPTTLNIC